MWFRPGRTAIRSNGNVLRPFVYLNLLTGSESSLTFNRASVATYADSSGDIQTAAVDVARIDHDTDSPYTATGLMIEGGTDVFYTQALELNFVNQSYAVSAAGTRSADSASLTVYTDQSWSIFISLDIGALDGTAIQFGDMLIDIGASLYTLTVGATSSTGGTTALGTKELVVTCDGTTSILYVNGVSTATVTAPWHYALSNVTAVGNAQISTALSKFGGSSVLFDGTGDYLDVASNSLLSFGTGDFTIEGWFWLDSSAAGHYLFASRRAATATGVILLSGVGGALQVLVGNGTIFPVNTTSGAIALDTWHHIAMTRSGGTVRVFVDGSIAIIDNNAAGVNVAESQITIGTDLGNPGVATLKGYVDDFRVTKGVALYTSAFTAPTAAFPNSIADGDANFASVGVLIHGDGTNGAVVIPNEAENDDGSSVLVIAGKRPADPLSAVMTDQLASHVTDVRVYAVALTQTQIDGL